MRPWTREEGGQIWGYSAGSQTGLTEGSDVGVQEEPGSTPGETGPVLGIGAAVVILEITRGALAATRGLWLKQQEQLVPSEGVPFKEIASAPSMLKCTLPLSPEETAAAQGFFPHEQGLE